MLGFAGVLFKAAAGFFFLSASESEESDEFEDLDELDEDGDGFFAATDDLAGMTADLAGVTAALAGAAFTGADTAGFTSDSESLELE